jgi:hypothetical protein
LVSHQKFPENKAFLSAVPMIYRLKADSTVASKLDLAA